MTTCSPTRTRWITALWLCGLAGVLYLDRNCISQALKPMQDELKLSGQKTSFILMAFTLAYGLFEVPTGRLGDRHGSRRVLTRIVLWWSAFTALTGAAPGFWALLGIRFLFGAGEAGAFPNAARVIAGWFPVAERGRVQGVMLTASQLGGVLAPTLAAYVIQLAGWRWTFAVFGLLGVAWAVGFWLWFRDDPADHPGVNTAELTVIRDGAPPAPGHGPVPWAAVLANRGILVLSLLMVLGAFYTYFFYSWYPTALQSGRDVTNVRAGWLSSLVLAGSAGGVLVGGFVSDWITHDAADPVRARRRLGAGCYLVAAACMYIGSRFDHPAALSGWLCASMFAMHVTLPNWWSVAIPQCGRHVGALFGLMNGVGVVGAMASQFFVGAFADWQKARGITGREQWDPMLNVYVGVLLLAAVTWLTYRYRPLERDERA